MAFEAYKPFEPERRKNTLSAQLRKVGFFGLTHLGLTSAVVGADKGFSVICYDEDSGKLERLRRGLTDLKEPHLAKLMEANVEKLEFTNDINQLSSCGLIYISPDVDTDDDGNSDLATVERYLELGLNIVEERTPIVILSQVPPGFLRSHYKEGLRLFYQVETLIFGKAVERASQPERYIVGTVAKETRIPETYLEFLAAHGNPPVIQMSFESAELAKIAINCCLVASITAVNSLAEICEHVGADWDEIMPALRLDRRIGKYSYIRPGLGLAGGNLERDLSTVVKLGEECGSDVGVVKAWMANSRHRKNWPLEILKARVLPRIEEPRISILGLAYKENTDSVKNSPSIQCLEGLKGYDLRVFDPAVQNDVVPFAVSCQDIESCIDGSDILLIMTPWPEFKRLTFELLEKTITKKIVIDPWGCLKDLCLQDRGFEYFRLGN